MISINEALNRPRRAPVSEFKERLLQLRHYHNLAVHAAREMIDIQGTNPQRMLWLSKYYTRMRAYIYFDLMEIINRKTPPPAVTVGCKKQKQ